MIIDPIKTLRGSVWLPGDKSVSHRAAMFAAIADGTTTIQNFSPSEDCWSTVDCLQKLGVLIKADGTTLTVAGVGKHGFAPPRDELDCGNSGTTMRLLAGILSGQDFTSTLTGDDSLRGRPMKRIIDPLEQMGCILESADGRAPLTITGTNSLKAIVYQPPVASAQIKSCVLLAGLSGNGTTTVIEPVATRDHTERMLRWLGVEVRDGTHEGSRSISVDGDAVLTAADIKVPADISSAAFFMVAAACSSGADVKMENVGMNGSRGAIIDVLRAAGVDISTANEKEQNNEPVATVTVRGGSQFPPGPTILEGDIIPNLIDEIPILAVLGTQMPGGLEIRDASELRVKESDRIASVAVNLRSMGASVEERPDGMIVSRSHLRGAEIDSFGDHRIAMAFSIAGLFAQGRTIIRGAEAANVSFPGFYEVLDSVAVR